MTEPLTTISGKYYVGMKKQEAQRDDCYKKIVGIDFKGIDKDKNGILNSAEICAARDEEIERIKIARKYNLAGHGLATLGAAASMTAVGAIPGGITAIAGMGISLTAGLTIEADGEKNRELIFSLKQDEIEAEIEKTQQYRKKYRYDIKM